MFELNTKNLMIAGGVALAATAVIVGAVMWGTSRKWCPEGADKTYESMLDAYNKVIKDFPGDREKAGFAFEVAASEIRKTFVEANTDFDDELTAWLKRFDEQVKHLKKEIRKP